MSTADLIRAESDSQNPIYASFIRRSHVTIRNLVSRSQIEAFHHEIKDFPSRRVICGTGEVSWIERAVRPASSLFIFFSSEPTCRILNACLRRPIIIKDVICWISVYKAGEYINRHRDGAGDIQLIVSLKAATSDNGGWLNLESCGEKHRVFLEEGDALCFSATQVEHYTEPLVKTTAVPNPERVTAVARYFLAS